MVDKKLDGILDPERNPFLGDDLSWVDQRRGLTGGQRGVKNRLIHVLNKPVNEILAGDRHLDRFPAFVAVRWEFAKIINGMLLPTERWKHMEEYDAYGRSLQGSSLRQRERALTETVLADLQAYKEEEAFTEGEKRLRYVNLYERDPRNRVAAIRIHGTTCMACGFDFESVYGPRGKDYIEAHHLDPLSSSENAVQVDPEKDMAVVCANCHRMIHRYRDHILTIEELKDILRENSKR